MLHEARYSVPRLSSRQEKVHPGGKKNKLPNPIPAPVNRIERVSKQIGIPKDLGIVWKRAQEERTYNPFLRVRQPELQRWCKTKTAESTMYELRRRKDLLALDTTGLHHFFAHQAQVPSRAAREQQEEEPPKEQAQSEHYHDKVMRFLDGINLAGGEESDEPPLKNTYRRGNSM